MPARIPTEADVAAVATLSDPVARNLAVTAGYHAFSGRFRHHLGDEVSWPTLATWASAQAGQTIRREDLLRLLERRLGDGPAIRRLMDGPFRHVARVVLREMLALDPFARSSQAVSRGNIKVYAEVGAAFARGLHRWPALVEGSGIDAFLASLAPGPPPDGQDLLREAFTAYVEASRQPPGARRSQLVFLGNAAVGLHEQTRLQPEILAAVDGSVLDGLEIKARLLGALLPSLGEAASVVGGGLLARRLDPWLVPIVEELQRVVREIVTERMMVLDLPGGAVRLGQDLRGEFPEHLRTLTEPRVRALLAGVDLTPDSLLSSGAGDWTSFPERMHFIVDLFRSRQSDARLFEAPPGPQARSGRIIHPPDATIPGTF
ncbi:MAG: hypothetical protein HOP14_10675 [Acidobacteria bacterium]|nr:hypothetical protein [Acidobacteriota bacterium]